MVMTLYRRVRAAGGDGESRLATVLQDDVSTVARSAPHCYYGATDP